MNTAEPTTRRTVLRAVGHLAACAAFPTLLGAAPAVRRSAPAGALVMVIRHAEKPAGHGDGIAVDGRADRHSLTGRGWTRVVYLVDLFTSSETSTRAGLPAPTAIYASGVGPGNGEGTRSRETVGPLAAELGIPVNTSFSRGQEAGLAAAAAIARPGPTLVCWQHGAIPAIAAAFAQVSPAPPTVWPDARFDMVWAFTSAGAGWRCREVPQRLLPGDTGGSR